MSNSKDSATADLSKTSSNGCPAFFTGRLVSSILTLVKRLALRPSIGVANQTDQGQRIAILEAVKTPLGFFTLIALILDALLVAAGALTDRVFLWAALGVLVLLVALVAAIAMLRPDALYGPTKRVTVNLMFSDPAFQVDLDHEQSVIEVSDGANRVKLKSSPDLIFEQGGWIVRLGDLEASDGVRLELVERNARRWRVNRFAPYQKSVEARLVEDS